MTDQALTTPKKHALIQQLSTQFPLPAIVADVGETAARRFLEFFAAQIRNKNTRQAYYRAVVRFFDWCEENGLRLIDIEPLHISTYIELRGHDFSKPTVKQHLAAIRMLFDWLVTGHVIAVNPGTAVRGPSYTIKIRQNAGPRH